MAPEQKEGIASSKSDVFSFGVILLEALLCICKPQSVVPGHSNTSGPVPIITEWVSSIPSTFIWMPETSLRQLIVSLGSGCV